MNVQLCRGRVWPGGETGAVDPDGRRGRRGLRLRELGERLWGNVYGQQEWWVSSGVLRSPSSAKSRGMMGNAVARDAEWVPSERTVGDSDGGDAGDWRRRERSKRWRSVEPGRRGCRNASVWGSRGRPEARGSGWLLRGRAFAPRAQVPQRGLHGARAPWRLPGHHLPALRACRGGGR